MSIVDNFRDDARFGTRATQCASGIVVPVLAIVYFLRYKPCYGAYDFNLGLFGYVPIPHSDSSIELLQTFATSSFELIRSFSAVMSFFCAMVVLL